MKTILISTIALVSFIYSCTSDSKKPVETAPQDNTKTLPPQETRDAPGTSVQINNEGVNVRHKDSEGKSDVKISTDTFNVDIKKK